MRRDGRSRAGGAKPLEALTGVGNSFYRSEHGRLGRRRDRQCSARNGNHVGSARVQLLAFSILLSCKHENLPRCQRRSELLNGMIQGLVSRPLLSLEMTRS